MTTEIGSFQVASTFLTECSEVSFDKPRIESVLRAGHFKILCMACSKTVQYIFLSQIPSSLLLKPLGYGRLYK